MQESWRAELTVEMIPDGLNRDIAEAIGVDGLLGLARVVGGTTIYIQREETLLRPIREKKIREEFNGENGIALAKKYGITERSIRKIANQPYLQRRETIRDN